MKADHSQKIHILASDIIRNIKYMNIATVTPEGEPWNTPVYFAYDKNLHFFWHSWKDNQHSKNIEHNNSVFVTIYDSTVPEGTGFGVYLQGYVKIITDPVQLTQALTYLYKRTGQKVRAIKFFLNNFPRRAYQFIPQNVWINGDGELKKEFIDIREELDIELLIKLL